MNGLTLAVSIFATVSYISGEKLTGTGLTMGITPEEAERFGYNEPQTKSDLTAARGLLSTTPLADLIPEQKKNVKPDLKVVLAARTKLVYFLSARGNARGTIDERNRVVMALACLGFTKLAAKLAEKTNPVRIEHVGETLVLTAPSGSVAMKYHASKNGWKYHGDHDKKWAKNPPFVNTVTGENLCHVRTMPVSDEAKLTEVIEEAYKGRIVIRETAKGTTFRYVQA